jgi:NADH:ubiquinone oxidoreductase subunit 3 (subunit A)
MLRECLPALLQVIVAILFTSPALLVSVLVGKTGKRTPAKDTAYEWGMLPQGRCIQDRLARFAKVHSLLSSW